MRVIGIDDSPFEKKKDKKVLVTGTIYRGGEFMDGLVSCWVRKDGADSTKKLVSMIKRSKFYSQLKAIFINGIAVGGFNVIDLEKLSEKTGLPVITVIRKKPDLKLIKKTLADIGMEEKIALIEKAPKIEKVGSICIQRVNIPLEDAKKALKICTTNADVPECLRIAHIIGSGIILGESSGGA